MAVSFLLLAAAAAVGASPPQASAQVVEQPPVRACPPEAAVHAAWRAGALLRPQDRRGDQGAQTLGSLPPADVHLAVLRSVGGCSVPTKIRDDYQGDGRFARPR